MKQRLQDFLNEVQISPSKFAEALGVQTSAISHLLSGRNKPSFDFLSKMISTYPNLNPTWLINGNGDMFISTDNTPTTFSSISSTTVQEDKCKEIEEKETPIEIQDNTSSNTLGKCVASAKTDKKIERVIIFYTDKSFREYLPDIY